MGNENHDSQKGGPSDAPLDPPGELKCLSCDLSFRDLPQAENHTFDSSHADFKESSALPSNKPSETSGGDKTLLSPPPYANMLGAEQAESKPDPQTSPFSLPHLQYSGSSPPHPSGRDARVSIRSIMTRRKRDKRDVEENEVIIPNAEELTAEICRIDGSYQPGTRTHVYDRYNPMIGPLGLERSSIPQMYFQWALLVVREFNEDFQLRYTFLRINSTLIRQSLKNALPSGEAAFETSELRWPNDKLFRYRDKIRQAAKDISELAVEHTDLLIQLVESEYASRIRDLEIMLPEGVCSYEVLREAFWPGDIVFSTKSPVPRAYRVVDAIYRAAEFMQPPRLEIKAEYIDYDGEKLGVVRESLFIPEFEGVKYLHDLAACPINYLPNKEAMMNALKGRANKFLNLRGRNFKFYNGVVVPLERSIGRCNEVFKVRSRVMVDSSMLSEIEPSYRIEVSPLAQHHGQSELSDSDLLICTYQVPIFSFKDKNCFWGDVNQVTEISFNDRAFDQLILPTGQKEIVRAFVNSYSAGDTFDDFIAGKGKGLVFLLHGPPGVGKTMTAEAISDLLRRPLYAVTSGELGTSPSEMERRLQQALDRASYFSSVLLLDEADIFLEQRNAQDLTRNALVSTFLRLLEYYQGVMFLTTNRVSSFDVAVSSRIHITLHLDELTRCSREAIWRNLGQLNDVELDFAALARRRLNGRQIKNTFRSGVILAKNQGVKLSTEHMEVVFMATGFTDIDAASEEPS